jgi:predicted alpha-1,6-mannanase (GH76 family)
MALAGIPSRLVGGRRYESDVQDRLATLAHYFDAAAQPPGYDPSVLPPLGTGGDKYYDDAAWIGLAHVQHYRMTGAPSSLRAAQGVLAFVYPGGWDKDPYAPYPGGIFWVQQGAGVGLTNHDRTATSNAPNAELAFHLAQLASRDRAVRERAGTRIHSWVSRTLYDVDGSGLVYDHVRGDDGKLDSTLYTYNQGALVAADVMRYRVTGDAAWLARAQSLATAALAHFSPSYYVEHSAAFNAIYFRGLLQLHAVVPAGTLQAAIVSAMQTYAEAVWRDHRSPEGLFRFADSPANVYSVIDQGAALQLFAALAWDPADYPKLA